MMLMFVAFVYEFVYFCVCAWVVRTCLGLSVGGNACRALTDNAGCSHYETRLVFGNHSGLMTQPEQPKGRIIIFGARGGDDKKLGRLFDTAFILNIKRFIDPQNHA